ncbi:MAG TPA: hypothetical protein VLB27_06400, partial [candidate division Zixibacteria bacterium]|nr:hypothetical protein [candidate division Zixibacteria bacterium]
SEPGEWFTWRRTTEAHVTGAREFEGGLYFKARHTGFSAGCGFPVEVSREVILLDEGLCLLIDGWRSERPVHTSLNLTPHPSLTISTSGRMLYEEDGVEFHYLVSPQFAVARDDAEREDAAAHSGSSDERVADDFDPVRFCPKIIDGPYSRDYGVMGEAPVLHSDFGVRAVGAVVTVFSRVGAIRQGADPASFVIGTEGRERTLHVGASGKITLSALVHGKERRDAVEFAR